MKQNNSTEKIKEIEKEIEERLKILGEKHIIDTKLHYGDIEHNSQHNGWYKEQLKPKEVEEYARIEGQEDMCLQKLEAKLYVYKEWEQREKEILEIIEKWFNKLSEPSSCEEQEDIGCLKSGIINNLDIRELKSQIQGEK